MKYEVEWEITGTVEIEVDPDKGNEEELVEEAFSRLDLDQLLDAGAGPIVITDVCPLEARRR